MSKKRKSNFRNTVAEEAQEQGRRGYLTLPSGIKLLKIKEGTRRIYLDFLPYEITNEKHPDRQDRKERAVPGSLWYKRPFKTHKSIGPDNLTVVCPTTVGKKCPICEYIRQKLDTGADWDDVKDLATKQRNLYVVQPIGSDTHDEALHVWDMSQFLFQNELNDRLSEDPDNGVFPALEDGKTLEVKLKWKEFGKSSYPETRDIDFHDRETYDEAILDDVPNLDDMFDVMGYNQLRALLLGMDEEDLDESDEYTEATDNEIDEDTGAPPKRQTPGTKKEPEPKKEEKKTTGRQRKSPDKGKESEPEQESSGDDKCPHDHKFGVDWEDTKDCAKCKLWDECGDRKEELDKE